MEEVTEDITAPPVTAGVAVPAVGDRIAHRATGVGIPLAEAEEATPAGVDTQEAEVIVSPNAAPLLVLNTAN